jgi:tRNA G10  N-methylase Trm11
MSIADQVIYVFIPGKNWRLSLAELVSFLEMRSYRFEVCEFPKAFFVASVGCLNASAIADFGGIIKIGRVFAEVPTQTVEKAFVQKNKEAQAQIKTILLSSGIIDGRFGASSGRSVFGVSVYYAERSFHPISHAVHRFVGGSLKDELAAHGKKSRFLGFPRKREQPQLSHIEVLKKNLVENGAEVLFCIGGKRALISTAVAVHNPFEFQKRDICRPIQRKIFGISPRLARIMTNLAFCTSGKSLLDPFCGVGTILQEALLIKAKAIGVDINPWCVDAARQNLEWLKREYALKEAEYTVLQGDSRKLTDKIQQEVDCIATEPDLGPALRHLPTTPYATKIIEKLKPLYYGFLEEAYRILKKDGRLVLVTPYVKTRSGEPVLMRIEEKAIDIGFRSVSPFKSESFACGNVEHENLSKMSSFVDVAERHKIGREIHIFQKIGQRA